MGLWQNRVVSRGQERSPTSPINDPVYAFGKNYEPKDVLLAAIAALQERLACVPLETLTGSRLAREYRRLFLTLEETQQVVVTSYHRPTLMPEEQWLACQRTAIAATRRRLGG